MEREATQTSFEALLEARGVSRRSFLKLCGAVVAAAGASQLTIPQVADALEKSVIGAKEGKLYPVIWIEGASCTGCTEAFAQVETPDPATIVLEMISLNYSETLSAAAGYSMEEAKEQTIEAGNYILIYEGAVLEKWGGEALRVAGKPGTEHLLEAAPSANAVVALGSCAVNGGWMGANPNSAGAVGVEKFLKESGINVPVVNIPGCPANPEWLVAVLVDVVMMNKLPALDYENKPALIFDETIHDNCERRGHFENGEFVYQFGSEEEAKNYCLYAMGCRGPQTKANCGIVRYNNRRSWCVEAGAPCIGCCEAAPMDPGHNWVEVNTPFMKRHRDLRIGDWTFQTEAVCLGLTAIVAAGIAVHGFGIKASGRMKGKFRFEEKRAWDAKHPDRSVGDYVEDKVIVKSDGTTETVSAADFEKKQADDLQAIKEKFSKKGGSE